MTVSLREWTTCGGCAAKWGAGSLAGIVESLAAAATAAGPLLVGLAPFDDAAVYRLSDDLALVSTTDFFPPLVDDPADFGAIAAANACSDVFAMGGRVVLALNIAAFPEQLPVDAIGAIVGAAAEVVAAAGGVIAGGHTIRSEEPIFGLAVQGLVHPERAFTKGGARPGEVVVLSKPLGTGIVLAGGQPRRAGGRHRAHAGAQPGRLGGPGGPARLGRSRHRRDRLRLAGARLGGGRALRGPPRARRRRAAALRRRAGRLPRPGCAPAATPATGPTSRCTWRAPRRPPLEALAYDPQTSGGLLASVDADVVDELVAEGFVVIGRVVAGAPKVALG